MKRFGVRRRARYYGGGLAIVVFVAVTLFVVLPAIASNPGDKVPPVSAAGITPTDVNIGGNAVCSNLFPGFAGVREYDNPSPKTAANLPSGNNDGVTFSLTTSGNTNNQRLAVTSSNAAILGLGVKGGNDNAVYDYTGTDYGAGVAAGFVNGDSVLHAPASKFTGVDGTGLETGVTQWYTISHLVVCYRTPLKTVSGRAYQDISGTPPLSGLKVTLIDKSVAGGTTQTATTSASGNYSFSAVAGDNYTVCIQAPAFSNVQTVPATDTGSCTGTKGYSITSLSSSNGSGKDFGFQPYGTVSGTVYQDVNGPNGAGPDGAFESGTDTRLGTWTVTLYDQSGHVVGSPTMSGANGSYSLSAPFDTSQTYTVCVTPPSGVWSQTEPLPTAANSCAPPLSGLQKGQQFTPSTPRANVTKNFGVDPAVNEPTPCPPQVPFGSNQTNGELQIQLAGCKPFQTFTFSNGTLPDGSLWASVFAADQVVTPANPEIPLIEKWTFPDPIKADGTPTFTHVDYTDVFPYDPAAAQELPQCKLDPRDPSDPNAMTISTDVGGVDFTLDANKGLVLPAFNPDGTTPATSCAISTRIYVDASGNTWLEVYAYSDIDSWGKSAG